MKIGFDLDEVLADFLPALIEYHNATYGTSLMREQFYVYKPWEIWGGTKEDTIQEVYDFHKTSYFKNIEPIIYAQEAVNILKRDNELIIITSRQDDIAEETREWVAQHFPDSFSDIFFTNNYSQNGRSRSKKQVCDSSDVDILIEDSLDYALECLSPKRKVFLLDCPWNKSFELAQGISRVYSWKEIVDAIACVVLR